MSIRRRLFWSNILMIVIPVALSTLIAYFILFVFTKGSDVPMEQAFPQTFEAVMRFRRTKNLDQLLDAAEYLNENISGAGVFMAVMHGEHYIYPDDADDLVRENGRILGALLRDGATGSVNINNRKFLIEQVDDYRIILVERGGERPHYRRPIYNTSLILVTVLIVILFTNRMLTYLLARSITIPLKKLADGAHRLGSGELDYRIEYTGRDEFADVCRAFNEMAEQLQKLVELQRKNEESRKELLAGISHDLRTPLTSVKAYVEGLLDGVAEDLPSQLKYLGIIRNKAGDIERIVDKLFLFSKLDIGEYPVKPEKLDIGEELESMAAAVEEEYASKGLSVVLEDHVQDAMIWMDPVCLNNIFTNILENSVRYKSADHCTVTVRCFVGEETVTVRMTDDGPGVQKDELDKIFQVFYRADPSRQNPSKGSGLGLAISATMMNRTGGTIHAELPECGGLRMVLRFQRYVEDKTEGSDKRLATNTDH